MAQLLGGKEISKKIRADVEARIKLLGTAKPKPVLAIVLATKDESASTYVRIIKKAAEKVGITANIIDLGEEVTHELLMGTVKTLAEDINTHGIIIQTPIREGIDIDEARSLIPLEKDVDGTNPLSAGKLFSNLESFAPATALAVIEILKSYGIEIAGKHAVVIGRSRIVGKPVAHLLLNSNATTTVCHIGTKDLAPYTKTADILVVAVGKIGLISKKHIDKDKDTVVIDVGTNFNPKNELVGDVKFKEVEAVARAITPVPGGVGPVTTAILLRNTIDAYYKQMS
jgi:methylenetetrahydrofolate dehydrogenase (NADP+)/methenyltetrahydrofolate cyclohydrolase